MPQDSVIQTAPGRESVANSSDVLTPREAAQFMRCGLSTIRRWTAEGRIPVHSIAGRPRYIRAELLGVLEARLTN